MLRYRRPSSSTGSGFANGKRPFSAPRMIILCDFDETAAAQNVARLLLERFQPDAAPSGAVPWQDVRQRYVDKEISLAEYQEIAFRQLTASVDEQRRYVREAAGLRPGFAELARHCAGRGVSVAIVSHGLDYYVEATLDREAIDIPYHAVTTSKVDGAPEFSYEFADEGCQWWPGNCKCRVLEEYRKSDRASLPAGELRNGNGAHVVYAGDSASDACPAVRADFVFARGWLTDFCRENDLPHAELTDFYAVIEYVEAYGRESA